MKSKKEIEKELLMKEQRVSYWERFGVVLNNGIVLNNFQNELNKEVGI